MAEAKKPTQFFGFDVSTTSLSLGTRNSNGKENFVSVPMQGETEWHGQPAFDLDVLPDLLLEILEEICQHKYKINFSDPGVVSFSLRQHDMVLFDKDFCPLIPALSWQCNAATNEVAELQQLGAEKIVGRIEPRFLLPKLMWTLKQDAGLFDAIRCVMTTGDYISFLLTGKLRTSTSDALSNSLVSQRTKELAKKVIECCGLKSEWFPPLIQSGEKIGFVLSNSPGGLPNKWYPVKRYLARWQVIAGLGDNHATGVGCGLADFETIVISAGTSGTINRMCLPETELAGEAACFEYYEDRLLLLMLANCAKWYDNFVECFGCGQDLERLNSLALEADLDELEHIYQEQTEKAQREIYPGAWTEKIFPSGEPPILANQVASTQASIALQLLLLVKKMLKETKNAPLIHRFVLTGGLSQSEFLQQVMHTGISMLVESPSVMVSNRTGPLAFQTAAFGAMTNAMLGAGEYINLSSAVAHLCPLRIISLPSEKIKEQIRRFLSPLKS